MQLHPIGPSYLYQLPLSGQWEPQSDFNPSSFFLAETASSPHCSATSLSDEVLFAEIVTCVNEQNYELLVSKLTNILDKPLFKNVSYFLAQKAETDLVIAKLANYPDIIKALVPHIGLTYSFLESIFTHVEPEVFSEIVTRGLIDPMVILYALEDFTVIDHPLSNFPFTLTENLETACEYLIDNSSPGVKLVGRKIYYQLQTLSFIASIVSHPKSATEIAYLCKNLRHFEPNPGTCERLHCDTENDNRELSVTHNYGRIHFDLSGEKAELALRQIRELAKEPLNKQLLSSWIYSEDPLFYSSTLLEPQFGSGIKPKSPKKDQSRDERSFSESSLYQQIRTESPVEALSYTSSQDVNPRKRKDTQEGSSHSKLTTTAVKVNIRVGSTPIGQAKILR